MGESSVELSSELETGRGSIHAERIEFRDLMQEAFLRRDRNHHAAIHQQDRLTKLKVPIPERKPLALERRNRKIRPLEKVEHRFWVPGIRTRGRLADHANRGP